jgi:hypothetical protein
MEPVGSLPCSQEPSTDTYLNQINPVHTTPSKMYFNIVHLRLGLPSGLFPSGFPTKILYEFLFSPWVLHALPISYPPLLDHSNCIRRREQVMKLLIMQFSPTTYHFCHLWSKHFLQHPVL